MKFFDQPRAPLNQKQTLGFCLALLLVGSSYHLLWLSRERANFKSLSAEVTELRKNIEKGAVLQAQLSERIRQVASQPGQTEKYATMIDYNENFSRIFSELSGASSKDLFSVKKISVEKEEEFDDYRRALFTIELDASFISVGEFLARLESSPLFTEVVSIDMGRMERELKRCSAKIKLYSYIAKK